MLIGGECRQTRGVIARANRLQDALPDSEIDVRRIYEKAAHLSWRSRRAETNRLAHPISEIADRFDRLLARRGQAGGLRPAPAATEPLFWSDEPVERRWHGAMTSSSHVPSYVRCPWD